MTQSKCTALLIGMFLLLGVVISPLAQAHKVEKEEEEKVLLRMGWQALNAEQIQSQFVGKTFTVNQKKTANQMPIYLKEGGTRWLQWKDKTYSTPWKIENDQLCMDSLRGGTDCFAVLEATDSSGAPMQFLCSKTSGKANYKLDYCYWHIHEILEGNPKNLK